MVELLVAHGANLNTKSVLEETPLGETKKALALKKNILSSNSSVLSVVLCFFHIFYFNFFCRFRCVYG